MKKNVHLATEILGFWQGKKAENIVFYFWRRDSRHLFVSDSWYCQIHQTTRLIMFFNCIFHYRVRAGNFFWLFSEDELLLPGEDLVDPLPVEHGDPRAELLDLQDQLLRS